MMSVQSLETRYAWMRDRMGRRRADSLVRVQALRKGMEIELKKLEGLTRTARKVRTQLDAELRKLERWAAE